MAKRTYRCKCDRYCKGIERTVSRSIWFAHRQQASHVLPQRVNIRRNRTAAQTTSSSASNAAPARNPAPVEQSAGIDHPLDLDNVESLLNAGPSIQPPPAGSPASPSDEDGQDVRVQEGYEAPAAGQTRAPTLADTRRPDDSLPSSITGSRIVELDMSIKFRRALEAASLDNGDLSADQLERLRNPTPQIETLDPDTTLALRLFLSTRNAAESVYREARLDILQDEVNSERDIPSYEGIKKKVAELTGVTPIMHDMCPNTCMAYTGPFKDLDTCSYCGTTRYDPKTRKPRQHLSTMPLGQQIQARWKDPASAKLMQHRWTETVKIMEQLETSGGCLDEYSDIYHGQDYLEAVKRGDIGADDTLLMFSMDGAQLYHDKQSDCWIYIWVILDMAPDQRYKKRHVIPGGVIPGPNNPKNMESFLFPGYHHLAALQKEGLAIYHGTRQTLSTTNLFLFLGSADGPAGTYFTGFVGHHGYYFCRLYCGTPGRHKPERPHYYGALLKPNHYNQPGCNHDDIHAASMAGPNTEKYQVNLITLLGSTNQTDYKNRRKKTGLSGPSIFSGLPPNRRLPLPRGFVGDSMHVPTLNLGDLFLPLWRGTFQAEGEDRVTEWEWAVLKGDTWVNHGAAVGACRPYLPGSFDRPPRDLAKKIKSGYKAKEWQHYFYGLAVALLYDVLPLQHWQNFCKLVYAIRLLHQRTISRQHLQDAHQYMAQFHEEFELLYVQRRVDRIHFMRPCLHFLIHMAPETVRMGPVPLSSTWTMERMIGDLGGQIRQPSNPYQNLSQRGLLQCQVNTLIVAYPHLVRPASSTPRVSESLGNGYFFLSARERTPRVHKDAAGVAIRDYFVKEEARSGNTPPEGWAGPRVRRWARLQLPNGQVARCAWKECVKAVEDVRRARCVKMKLGGDVRFGEVHFYFFGKIGDQTRPLALVSVYSPIDQALFEQSFWTLMSVRDLGEAGLRVIDATSILSVVAAVPWSVRPDMAHRTHDLFIYERLGMEISLWSESLDNGEDDPDMEGDDDDI